MQKKRRVETLKTEGKQHSARLNSDALYGKLWKNMENVAQRHIEILSTRTTELNKIKASNHNSEIFAADLILSRVNPSRVRRFDSTQYDNNLYFTFRLEEIAAKLR